MSLRQYPTRLLATATLSSLLLLGVCGTVAVYLEREQARTADVLGEDLGSRKAASDLEELLDRLVPAQLRGDADLADLRREAEAKLDEIDRLADESEELVLAGKIRRSFEEYRRLSSADAEAAVRQLSSDTLPACRQLRKFNAAQSEASEQQHRRSLRRMTWGLAVVGGSGSVAGLVLGFALARSLRRTIHELMVRVQGAADLLGQEVPAVEWGKAGPPGDGSDELVHRVGQVVQKLQQTEREARRAERLAAVGQLAAGVAHEVRNPLTSALLLIETARKDPAAGGLTDQDLDLIEQELARIERSIQAFIDYARPPRLERSEFDLIDVVRDALGLARGRVEQQRVEVRLDVPEAGLRVNADRDQLRQVVLNLVLNALDAMPSGGRLLVAVRRTPRGVGLTVADTGAGIAADILPRLFEPFATGKETGLGLGLVVSKRIVEDHGGTVRGSNRPEGGACFEAEFPAA